MKPVRCPKCKTRVVFKSKPDGVFRRTEYNGKKVTHYCLSCDLTFNSSEKNHTP